MLDLFGQMTLEQLKSKYKNGEQSILEDEYLGDDGLPYCIRCGGKRYYHNKEHDWATHGLCKCQEEQQAREEEELELKRRMSEFRKNRLRSLLGSRYLDCMFDNSIETENNKEAYEKCRAYVEASREMYVHNIGLYIYGNNSSGKTHLTACLCNELVYKGHQCIYTNLASILNEIRASYDGNGLGESDIMRQIQGAEFAFIDDLGKEFIGREFNAGSSKWAESKLFEVINSRYNAERPTVFTSNFSIKELATVLNLDSAIVERINEMSTRVIKLEGDDFRGDSRKSKSELAKEFGV